MYDSLYILWAVHLYLGTHLAWLNYIKKKLSYVYEDI